MLYRIGWLLSRLILTIFGRMKSIGSENVPKKGGIIFAPNHISYMDPPAVGCGIRRRHVRYMAKIELFRIPVLGWLIKGVGAFPVKQHTADRTALKKALELLENGESICIFPEGTRSPDGNPMKAQSGIGMVALKSRSPVVPVALIGTDKVLPLHSFFLHFGRVKVIYGQPMTFDDLYERGMDRESIEEVGERVMAAIIELRSKNCK